MTNPDLSEFHRRSKPKKRACEIGLILAGELSPKLKPGGIAELAAALATDRGIITTGAICEWLEARGHQVSVPQVTSHRRHTCTCGRDNA